MIKNVFKELALGQKQVSRGRTITETDVVHFCMLTGNWIELHSNTEFAKETKWKQRIVQGSLVFSIGNGMFEHDSELIEAFYGVDKLRFLKPTFIGDTITSTAEIINLREKGDDHGVATVRLIVGNQRGEAVLSCEFSLLVRHERLKPDSE